MSEDARGWLVALSSLVVAACSGSSITDSARTIDTTADATTRVPTDASTGTSTDANEPTGCSAPLVPPQIRLEPHCASFTPALTNVDLAWVGRESITGEPKLTGHRFTAAADGNGCGFDVVVGLAYVTFDGASGSPYQMSGWWSEDQTTGSRALVAIVLRNAGDQVPVLGVADASSGGLLVQLSAPLVFGGGPSCDGSRDAGAAYLFLMGLRMNGATAASGSCTWHDVLVTCDLGGTGFTAVDYVVPRGSSPWPMVYGRSALLHK
jgi:hypothetical protein